MHVRVRANTHTYKLTNKQTDKQTNTRNNVKKMPSGGELHLPMSIVDNR